MEKDFCRSLETKNNTHTNALVLYTDRVVFNEIIESTDLYGKPYTIFVHNGGVSGIAKDAKEILSEDFRDHLDLNLYKGILPETPVVQPGMASAPQPPANGIVTERTQAPDTPVHSSPTGNRASDQLQENTIIKADDAAPQEQVQLSLFDLFGSAPQASVVAAPVTTTKRKLRLKGLHKEGNRGCLITFLCGRQSRPIIQPEPHQRRTAFPPEWEIFFRYQCKQRRRA
ncbi:hypothetical protein KRR40_32475 [Niabella defluvii]|nr:hypothetical protein KRR40_32475 [Niabella sp. I65]